jgi:hypothetical protein
MVGGEVENERPGIEERYETASNTSDLTLQLDTDLPGGAADVLIAAAWGETRMGGALLRLHSEWSGSEKPAKPTKESIKALVGTFQKPLPGLPKMVDDDGMPRALTGAEAAQYASAWYAHEMGLLLQKLKTLPAVREQLTIQAMKWRMGEPQDPITRAERSELREADAARLKELREAVEKAPDEAAKAHAVTRLGQVELLTSYARGAEWKEDWERASDKVAAVLRYWLDQTCQTCHGRKFRLIPGTPALSNKACPACNGSGVALVPHHQDGRKLANYLDQCVHRARLGIRNHLRTRR